MLVLLYGLLAFASCESKDQECYEPILVRASNSFVITDTLTISVPVGSDTTIRRDSLVKNYRDSIMPLAEMKVLDETQAFTVIGTEPSGSNQLMRVAFNPSKDSIRYTFRTHTDSTVYDTITFFYTPIVHFISNSCGYNYYFTINNVKSTHNLFDSVALPNSSVTNDIGAKNVQLYFKTDF